MADKQKIVKIPLPAPVLESDLKYPSYATTGDESQHFAKGLANTQFELWYTERFGWCIPTLLISSGRRMNTTDRTYAIAIKDKQLVRIGKGPHVLRQVTVYITEARKEVLLPMLVLLEEGQVKSGDTRDRISTRRANTINRRDFRSFLGF